MSMPSQSWKEFVGGIKLAIIRGEERKMIHPKYLLYFFTLSLPVSFFPFRLSPFVWECHASLDTMPSTQGS